MIDLKEKNKLTNNQLSLFIHEEFVMFMKKKLIFDICILLIKKEIEG